MGKFVAALYAGNRIVTGVNHGDAFSKLNQDEQDGPIESGFLDPTTGKFFTEEIEFYSKQVYLIRHAQAEGQHYHACLTELGHEQSRLCGEFLARQQLPDDICFCCSPYDRCVQTSEIVSEVTTIHHNIDADLRKQDDDEPDQKFIERIHVVLDKLPAHSLIISHTDFILHFVHEAIGPEFIKNCCVQNCAITMIDARRLISLYRR